jgi:autotransporter-associated beta strand protein
LNLKPGFRKKLQTNVKNISRSCHKRSSKCGLHFFATSTLKVDQKGFITMKQVKYFTQLSLVAAVVTALAVTACGGGGTGNASLSTPVGVGYVETAASDAAALPFVDYAYSNQRGDARYATKETNAGVRVLAGFLDLWTPTLPASSTSAVVDGGGTTAAASGVFPAVVASTWTGIPGDATDGKVLNATVHKANIQYVIDATKTRTAAQEIAAYEDDRRGKGYSVTDGMGPLTSAWRTAAQQTTTIAGIPADAATVKYDDKGNNVGVGSATNTTFGTVVDLLNNTIGANGSTEPGKRYYKYARPWRWTDSASSPSVASTWTGSVSVPPSLNMVKGGFPTNSAVNADGGFLSGHAAEATRDALAMAYVIPERFQEEIARGLELGENRILAGMHSPLDVIGGRIQAQAVAAANLTALSAAQRKAVYDQAHTVLMAAAGTTDLAAFNTYAHSATLATDRFADHDTNKANYLRRLTYGFSQIADATKAAVVPKGAEILIETRLPYLTADQRRVVLKTTALPSGYPAMDDAEGWGRLNLFAAADGYGAFNGDVTVTMDAALGGFNAQDSWKNDIAGKGLLTKNGTGTLRLAGNNSYSGGNLLNAGALQADSTTGFGGGNIYVNAGSVICNAAGPVQVGSNFTQLPAGTLRLNLRSSTQGTLAVAGIAIISGTLNVQFANGYTPKVGDTLTVVTAARGISGSYTTVTVQGFKVTTTYTDSAVRVHIDS